MKKIGYEPVNKEIPMGKGLVKWAILFRWGICRKRFRLTRRKNRELNAYKGKVR